VPALDNWVEKLGYTSSALIMQLKVLDGIYAVD
jgi:hypothetical protein